MSRSDLPDLPDHDVDYHHDWLWRRQEAALKSLSVSDLLSEVDDLIASEPDEQKHPLYFLAAHVLGHTTLPGSAESLHARLRRLVDHAVERLIEQRLADVGSWED